jgi:hypothetical protein
LDGEDAGAGGVPVFVAFAVEAVVAGYMSEILPLAKLHRRKERRGHGA